MINPTSSPNPVVIAPRPKAATVIAPRPRTKSVFTRSYQDPRSRGANRKPQPTIEESEPMLTTIQRRFLAEYLADPSRSALQAALKAGYGKNNALSNAYALVRNPVIAKAIKEADYKMYKKLEITHERVLQEVATIAFANPLNYFTEDPENPGRYFIDVSKLREQQGIAIKNIAVDSTGKASVIFHDKLTALSMIGKQLGMFRENLIVGTQDGKPLLTINILDKIVAGHVTIEQIEQNNLPKGITQPRLTEGSVL
jgi:phage terminase small subunit